MSAISPHTHCSSYDLLPAPHPSSPPPPSQASSPCSTSYTPKHRAHRSLAHTRTLGTLLSSLTAGSAPPTVPPPSLPAQPCRDTRGVTFPSSLRPLFHRLPPSHHSRSASFISRSVARSETSSAFAALPPPSCFQSTSTIIPYPITPWPKHETTEPRAHQAAKARPKERHEETPPPTVSQHTCALRPSPPVL